MRHLSCPKCGTSEFIEHRYTRSKRKNILIPSDGSIQNNIESFSSDTLNLYSCSVCGTLYSISDHSEKLREVRESGENKVFFLSNWPI